MHFAKRRRAPPHFALRLGMAALVAVGLGVAPALAEQDDDAERVPSNAGDLYSPIARTFTRQPALPGGPLKAAPQTALAVPEPTGPVLLEDLKQRLEGADPVFRDMIVNLYGRTHYLDRNNSDGTTSKAWAAGSALAVISGYFDGWLQLEAAVATSQPVYAPEDDGGTLLLTDQQAEVSSLAIANARIRLPENEIVVGRQLIKTPYLNPQDNRMIPNTVEGAALERRRDRVETIDYGIGYFWGFKARDSSYFVPFSEELGLAEDRGMLVGGVKVSPFQGLTVGAIDYLIPDTLNTAYVEVDWLVMPVGADLQIHLAANYTGQRTIGDPFLVGRALETQQISVLVAASYGAATVLGALSANGRGANVIGPFGSFPAYTVLDQLNFNNAGETTVVVGAAYDFSDIITDGLKFQARYGSGWGLIDPLSGAPQSDEREVNFELEYHPTSGPLKDFFLQVFYSGVRFPGQPASEESQPQFRTVVTYLVPLL